MSLQVKQSIVKRLISLPNDELLSIAQSHEPEYWYNQRKRVFSKYEELGIEPHHLLIEEMGIGQRIKNQAMLEIKNRATISFTE